MSRCLHPALLLALAGLRTGLARAEVRTSWDNDTDGLAPGAATTDRDHTQGTRVNLFGAPGALPAPASSRTPPASSASAPAATSADPSPS